MKREDFVYTTPDKFKDIFFLCLILPRHNNEDGTRDMMKLAYIEDGLQKCSIDAFWNYYLPLEEEEIILVWFIHFSEPDQ